ncbi:MAG: glycoside hydrolase family 3 C-terminal domain-containing protein [Steroidobacteraceae bacterium]
MSHSGKYAWAALVAGFAVVLSASAQDTGRLPYMNPSLSPEVRAADLVHRMTLGEKASQLVNQARAIPRLGVPAYDWWSEALHGVAVNGTTEFPEPIGLAATFDVPRIREMATAIGVEGRIKHLEDERAGHSNIFEGLDFWAPNVNIFRDPRWGRGQETYGEDPFLAARLAVAFVTGMQGNDPHYYRVISTPKHFDVHSGPEPTRHFADVDVSRHDEEDTYLPAFRAAIVEGHAGSVMCAYNAINGEPACANEFLLQHTLRGAWQFQGYVVSDCGAIRDVYIGHHYRSTQPEASAIALERGMDNECIDFRAKVTDDHDYRPYIDAVQQGYLSESAIDTSLIRLFTARIRLGMFDPPSRVPYARIDESQLDGAAHRNLARRVADESMVLLKNDGVLPLKGVKRIAIVGPLANQTAVLLGNYTGIPTHTVSMLEGMRAEFPGATITYVPGTQFLSNGGRPVSASRPTTPDGRAGLAPVSDEPDPAAIDAARNADVVIAVVGITSRLEGEEMRVDQPGFFGGDRTSLDLPAPEEKLVQALAATHKPLVVVLFNGSALAVNWEKAHADAILEAWYSGEEGGAAIAETLSGKNDPAGRLPVTFYQDVHQLPPFEDYSMKGRTYRYFEGEPLWPFGYGLTYTKFAYSGLTLPDAPIDAGEPLNVAVTVTNAGKLAGDEVVQLYLKFPDVGGAPIRALRGFERIHLAPGASRRVEFHLARRDLSMVTDAGDIIVAQGRYTVSVGGGQPGTGAPSVSGDFEVNGQIQLPE